jgi:DNA-binding response OmpR family regulator
MLNRLRVLIVEDEGFIGLLLEDMVTALGHAVAAICGTLKDGLEKAQALDFELAIVDIKLREETSAPILEILDRRQIPSIISSGYGDLEKSIVGSRPLLVKPYMPTNLAEAIRLAMRVP